MPLGVAVGRLASAFQRALASHQNALAHLELARTAVSRSIATAGGAGLANPAGGAGLANPAGGAGLANPAAPGGGLRPGVIPAQAGPADQLDGRPGVQAPVPMMLRELVEQLDGVGRKLVPGWLGEELSALLDEPLAGLSTVDDPVIVRIGEARVPGAGAFPAVVPILGGNHLVLDTDARDPWVAGMLRSLVLRLVAAAPAGSLRVLVIDQAALGGTFLPLRGLVEAGVMAPPAASEEQARQALDEAGTHAQRSLAGAAAGGGPWLLVVACSAGESRADLTRLATLTHAGAAARVCVVAAGWPEVLPGGESPALGAVTRVQIEGGRAWVGDPPRWRLGADGRGLAAPVALDTRLPAPVVARVVAEISERVRRESTLSFTDLIPPRLWEESSVEGLRTAIGRAGPAPVELAFDDATPHWLIGGRTGAGKTVFLLDVLYGLATRYSPDELALYLLDFKEGISFTEFTPTVRDPSFIPHARAVGIESDREYGVAVLRELRREINRRAAVLKRNAATNLAELRRATPDDETMGMGGPGPSSGSGPEDIAMPRIVAVIDEFQVLFERSDRLAGEATALLEELARKGRSYGIHLVLASQTVSGVEALYGKNDSIFGQFPLRIALPGGSGVLDTLNNAADGLRLGSAIVNSSGGVAGADTVVRFPDAHADRGAVAEVRHRIFELRTPGAPEPAVFAGYATRQVEDDPTFRGLTPGRRRPVALVGRVLDVAQSTGYFALDATPGRHVGVVGTSVLGADVLHAAAVSVARQHAPGTARFLVAPLVAGADEVADETVAALRAAGHPVTVLDAPRLREELRVLAEPAGGYDRTYLVVFGVDAASGVLSVRDPELFRSGLDDLRAVLRGGPAAGVHLLGWWRGLRRLSDDIGGTSNREDVSCLVVLNVPGQELGLYLGEIDLAYQPRSNRALLVDRDEQRTVLLVPFVRPGRVVEEA
ncbi:FtsK/SpoIIIE domain-containing protein [Rugosimonospora acidiphila]